jgi:hypothetical protein
MKTVNVYDRDMDFSLAVFYCSLSLSDTVKKKYKYRSHNLFASPITSSMKNICHGNGISRMMVTNEI